MPTIGEITILLRKVEDDQAGAVDRLMEMVYPDLERIALSHLNRRFAGRVHAITIEPAGLVNETYLRLIKQRNAYDNRGQFFAIATKVMLRVLCDYQRERQAAKRGGDLKKISLYLDGRPGPGRRPGSASQVELEPLMQALQRLETLDMRQAEVVKLRTVWGLEIDEIAAALGTSPSTVKRDWRFAKAWLAEELAGPSRPGATAGALLLLVR